MPEPCTRWRPPCRPSASPSSPTAAPAWSWPRSTTSPPTCGSASKPTWPRTTTTSGIRSDHVDQHALGELWAPVWAEGLERTRAVRTARPDDRFLDVDYPDLVGD